LDVMVKVFTVPSVDVYSWPVDPLTLNGVAEPPGGVYVPVKVPVMRPTDPYVPDWEYCSPIAADGL